MHKNRILRTSKEIFIYFDEEIRIFSSISFFFSFLLNINYNKKHNISFLILMKR